jgi:hypothetical protein
MRIGIGITTWKRADDFKELLSQIKDLDDRFFFAFVFDGPFTVNNEYDFKYITDSFGSRYKNYRYGVNAGVSKVKNKCIDLLNEFDVDFIFLLDDDMMVLDTKVFDLYIEAHTRSGLEHLMFSHVDKNTTTYTLMVAEDFGITTHSLAQGAFMFFTKDHLRKIGKFDEGFKNAFEHIDMTYRSYTAQELPFWFFLDVLGSNKYLKERGNPSTITNKEPYALNIQKSSVRWMEKYGKNVADIPRLPVTILIDRLKKIKNENSSRS